MICQQCSNKAAVVTTAYSRCEKHFTEYVIAKVFKIIKKYEIDKRLKILLAYSGGKDSSVALFILKKLGFINIQPVFIKLDFDFFNSIAYDIEKDIKIIDIKKEFDISANSIKSKTNSSFCKICSTIKRYFLNHYAYTNGYDLIVTGHNMSDIITSAFLNIKNNFFLGFSNLSPYLQSKKELKLVARLKPLFFLTDFEIKKFAEINSVKHSLFKCQYSINNFFKKHLSNIENEDYTTVEKMANSLIEFSKKVDHYVDLMKIKSIACSLCGYPSTSGICSFCKNIKSKLI